jgi:hypothetical protein
VSVSFPSKAPTQLRNRWVIGAAILLALAAALSVATFSRADLARQVRDAASAGLVNMKTVAAMLADRSPGQRPEGALASMKPEKRPALHERALPKIRKPESPLAGIVGTPTVPPVELPPATPLYSMVTTPPVAQTLVPGGPGGGSPPAPPPGGSGGIVVPPQTPAVPVTPVTPVTPAVPEPNTWAMMLVGFGLMGWAIRREKRAAAAAAG